MLARVGCIDMNCNLREYRRAQRQQWGWQRGMCDRIAILMRRTLVRMRAPKLTGLVHISHSCWGDVMQREHHLLLFTRSAIVSRSRHIGLSDCGQFTGRRR